MTVLLQSVTGVRSDGMVQDSNTWVTDKARSKTLKGRTLETLEKNALPMRHVGSPGNLKPSVIQGKY